MTDIIIFGVGKIADVVGCLVEAQSDLTVKGFTCDRAFVTAEENQGRRVVPFEEIEAAFPPATHRMLVAIGYHDLTACARTVAERPWRRGTNSSLGSAPLRTSPRAAPLARTAS